MKIGDYCRVDTAPARFLGGGWGVYVSSQGGYELMTGAVRPAQGNEKNFPHADDFEVAILAVCVAHEKEDRPFRSTLNTLRAPDGR